MFVRKRRNRSGSTSVVVIDKSSGKPKELVCIGVSSDEQEIEALFVKLMSGSFIMAVRPFWTSMVSARPPLR